VSSKDLLSLNYPVEKGENADKILLKKIRRCDEYLGVDIVLEEEISTSGYLVDGLGEQ